MNAVGKVDTSERDTTPHGESDGLFRKEARSHVPLAIEGEVRLARALSWWTVTLFLLVSLGLCLAISLIATSPNTERITGEIRPSAGFSVATAAESGRVTRLLAAAGHDVEKGQAIALIIPSASLANADDDASQRLKLISAQIATSGREALAAAAAARAQVIDAGRQVASLQAQNSALADRIARQELLLRSERADVADMESLARRGLITRSRLRAQENEVGAREEGVAELRSRQADNFARIDSFRTASAIAEAEASRNQARAQEARLTLERERQEISGRQHFAVQAGAAGRVGRMAVRSGDTVSTGDPVATIIPRESRFVAELTVPPHLIGWLRRGMILDLELDGLPEHAFGSARGQIVSLEGPIDSEQRDGGSGQIYQMRLELVGVPSRMEPRLASGIAVTARVQKEDTNFLRSALAWMFGV